MNNKPEDVKCKLESILKDITMLDHFKPEHPDSYIITADRGYESYDLLFHLELRK